MTEQKLLTEDMKSVSEQMKITAEWLRRCVDRIEFCRENPQVESQAAARNWWLHDVKADVIYMHFSGEWHVTWIDDGIRVGGVSDPDRDTAIDKARGVK